MWIGSDDAAGLNGNSSSSYMVFVGLTMVCGSDGDDTRVVKMVVVE